MPVSCSPIRDLDCKCSESWKPEHLEFLKASLSLWSRYVISLHGDLTILRPLPWLVKVPTGGVPRETTTSGIVSCLRSHPIIVSITFCSLRQSRKPAQFQGSSVKRFVTRVKPTRPTGRNADPVPLRSQSCPNTSFEKSHLSPFLLSCYSLPPRPIRDNQHFFLSARPRIADKIKEA